MMSGVTKMSRLRCVTWLAFPRKKKPRTDGADHAAELRVQRRNNRAHQPTEAIGIPNLRALPAFPERVDGWDWRAPHEVGS